MNRISVTLSLLLVLSFFGHSASAHSTQLGQCSADEWEHEQDPLTLFCSPVKFTRSGVRCFLRHVFNRAEYCEDFYPHSFSHVIEFLQYGNQTKQDIEYIISTLRLFNNKLKGSRFVTANAYSSFLKQLADVVEPYQQPEPQSMWEHIQHSIKSILYNAFLSSFSFFKEEPDSFFNDVAEQITNSVNENLVEDRVIQEQFHQTLVRFLENALNKVIWCPVNDEDVWESVKTISYQLNDLCNRQVITEDELDDLYKSLLEQFCHFLDLCGSDLSLDIINEIKADIESGQLTFLELEEQEEFLETKADRLTRSLFKTEAKAFARRYGIISEVLPAQDR